jgi:cytochrome c553
LIAALGAGALVCAHGAYAASDDVVSTLCVACHGEAGNSVVPTYPKLAGLQADYIAKQLKDFLAGKRKSDVMSPALESVKKGDVWPIAAYYAAQKPAAGKADDATLAAAGRKLYEQGNDASGVPGCVGCHHANGEGDAANPRIAGQHQAYTIQQMGDFRSGARSNDKGRVMRVIAVRMTDDEIKAVAEYLAAP